LNIIGAVDRKQLVARLLAKAKKYRNFTRWLGDRETIERISELTEKLERRARAVATPSERPLPQPTPVTAYRASTVGLR
jgi:hypothetical protein